MSHRVVTPGFERRDDRGVFREVLNGFAAQTLVTGTMRHGAVMGNHYHRKTRVFFYLTRGGASVRTIHVETGARDEVALGENQGVFLEPNESHAIRFLAESEFVMLKTLPYDPEDSDTYEFPV
ncbi:MAG: hypothetical protein ABR576_13105 [Thermoanaerobaculia bacterium]